jgi:hypothetical protein
MWKALHDADCPLDAAELPVARRNLAFSSAKTVWRAVQNGDFGLAWHRATASGLTPVDWIRYLRPPRRSTLAGVAR